MGIAWLFRPNSNASHFSSVGKGATLPNCGKLLKLHIPNQKTKVSGGQVNCLGYGHNSEDVTMDNPQPSSYVHSEYGEGSETK